MKVIYGRIDGPRAERGARAPWIVQVRVDHPVAAKANAQALDDLANGATGLSLVFKGHPTARGFGIEVKDVPRVLEGVALHAIALRVEGDAEAAQAVKNFIGSQPIDPDRLDISFSDADGRDCHEQGCAPAQELGVVLARAVARLREAEPTRADVTLAADQDMFATLAKFRAMRLLWSRVLEVCEIADEPLRIHAETSWRMMASVDPHANILRACAAVFGAGLGGADSICVLPFSLKQGLPNAFTRRIARNVQNVLLEESNLWRVSDPASGAGYVETLTAEMCDAAWEVFQNTERGEWPVPAGNSSLPVIGFATHRLAVEAAPEIESAP